MSTTSAAVLLARASSCSVLDLVKNSSSLILVLLSRLRLLLLVFLGRALSPTSQCVSSRAMHLSDSGSDPVQATVSTSAAASLF